MGGLDHAAQIRTHRPRTEVRSVLAECRRDELAVTDARDPELDCHVSCAGFTLVHEQKKSGDVDVPAVHQRAALAKRGRPTLSTSLDPTLDTDAPLG